MKTARIKSSDTMEAPPMRRVALYTYGILDPTASPSRMREFAARVEAVFDTSATAPGFVGRAAKRVETYGSAYVEGEDFGRWGRYVLPSDLPGFAGGDPTIHAATLSIWRDVQSARRFVYGGLHRDALKIRYDWFVKGPWPGHVIWGVAEGSVPQWRDGVERLQALARLGERSDHFTFTSPWARD